jgi:hypothetical protein
MSKFEFGKYKGRLLTDIATQDPSYFAWAIKKVPGFKELAAGIKPPRELRTLQIRSSSGSGGIKNEGFPRPGQKKFVSRARRPENHAPPSYLNDALDCPDGVDTDPTLPPW